MRWTPGGSSDDVEDRRDEGGSGGMQFGGIHLGIGGLLILLILSFVFHRNFFALLGVGTGGGPTAVTERDRELHRDHVDRARDRLRQRHRAGE